jgi:hypothetical protein
VADVGEMPQAGLAYVDRGAVRRREFISLPRSSGAPLVPKPGSDRQHASSGSRPSVLQVAAMTSSAERRVERRIPEDLFFKPVCSSLRASAAVWMLNISWQRSARSAGFDGTRGARTNSV